MSQPESNEQPERAAEQGGDTTAHDAAKSDPQDGFDATIRIIKEENDKVLNRIRQLFHLPNPPERK